MLLKTGVEYAVSEQKRGMDLLIVGSLGAVGYMAGRVLTRTLVTRGKEPTIFEQKRIGQDEEPFTILKFRSMWEGEHIPINRAAELLRKLGIDELAQVMNVLRGEASVVGHRPILPDEHEEFMDNLDPGLRQRWRTNVAPFLPGPVNSYGIAYHMGLAATTTKPERDVMKAELDIKDRLDGSMLYDARMLLSLVANVKDFIFVPSSETTQE